MSDVLLLPPPHRWWLPVLTPECPPSLLRVRGSLSRGFLIRLQSYLRFITIRGARDKEVLAQLARLAHVGVYIF